MVGFNWKFWEKGERKNAAPLDPMKEMVNVDGKDVPLQELYDALPDEPKKEEPKFNDDTSFETPKGPKTLGELKQAYSAKMKKNALPEDCPSCKGSGKKGAENAEAKPEGEPKPLPDLRDEKQNVGGEAGAGNKDAVEAAARKNAEDEAAKKAADEKAAAEKKNADDAAAKKAADDKAAEEKKNADDAAKADADKKAADERRNAGKAAFKDLRNAATSRTGEKVQPIGTQDERLAAGASRYGSAK